MPRRAQDYVYAAPGLASPAASAISEDRTVFVHSEIREQASWLPEDRKSIDVLFEEVDDGLLHVKPVGDLDALLAEADGDARLQFDVALVFSRGKFKGGELVVPQRALFTLLGRTDVPEKTDVFVGLRSDRLELWSTGRYQAERIAARVRLTARFNI